MLDFNEIKKAIKANAKERTWCTETEHLEIAQLCIDNGVSISEMISYLSQNGKVDAMYEGYKVSYRALYAAHSELKA